MNFNNLTNWSANELKKCLRKLQIKAKDQDYICRYCYDKFKKNTVPPTCIINNMFVQPIPIALFNLNDFEKIFIQLAKAFQVVITSGAIMKKNIPARESIKKS